MSCEGDSPETGNYLTTAEAARRMGVGKAEVREICRGGNLPGSYQAYPRGPWHIPVEAAEAWLREHAQGRKSDETSGPLRWWDRFRYNPFVFYPSIIAGALATLVTILAIVSIIADIGGARQQFKEWDPFRTAFQHARKDEVLVIIATFNRAEGLQGSWPHDEIKLAIDQTAAEAGFDQLRAEVHPKRLQAGDRKAAEKLGQAYDASIVIWGSETSVRWRVNYLNLRPECCGPIMLSVSETEATQMDSPGDYKEFVSRRMPSLFTFYALYTLAESYRGTGDYTKACEVVDKAIIAIPVDSPMQGLERAYFLLGWLHQGFAWDDPDKAVAYYTEAIQLKPDYAQAYYNRGLAHGSRGNFEQAIADYTEAIRLQPDDAQAYYNRGLTYSYEGNLDQALADYTEAIRLQPDDAQAYNNRGNVYAEKGDSEQAIADLTKAIRLNPNLAEAYNNRGVEWWSRGDYKRSIADYTKAIRLRHDYAEAYHNRGVAHDDRGDFENAIEDFTKATQLKPNLAEAYYNRGIAYGRNHSYEKAIADFTEAIRLNPDQAEIYHNRGVAYDNKGDYEWAIADFTEAIRLEPDFAEAYYSRGNVYLDRRDYDQAIADYTDAIRLKPDFVGAYFNRGVAYRGKGYHEQAIVDYSKVIQFEPDLAQAYHSRGMAYAHSGQRDRAIADMQKALALAVDDETREIIEQQLKVVRDEGDDGS